MKPNKQSQQLPSFVPSWATGMVTEAAQKYNIPASVIASMLQQESGFNVNAVSPAGAIGIAQFMPGTAQSYGINPHNPAQAIDAMGHYLRNSMDALGGNLPAAIASYNAGLGAVQKYGGVPPYAETQNYVRNVFAMSGMSGAQPAGQGQPQQQMPQQQGQMGQIPPTQVNNPSGAAPMPQMGQVANGGQMGGQQPQQGQVPGAMNQQMQQRLNQYRANRGNMIGQQSPFAMRTGMTSTSFNPNAPSKQQSQTTAPISLASILAQGAANAPTVSGQSATTNNITVPTSVVLPYLTGGGVRA